MDCHETLVSNQKIFSCKDTINATPKKTIFLKKYRGISKKIRFIIRLVYLFKIIFCILTKLIFLQFGSKCPLSCEKWSLILNICNLSIGHVNNDQIDTTTK